MAKKKESLLKTILRKIRRRCRGKLEFEKRLEELREKYEGGEKNPNYITWKNF